MEEKKSVMTKEQEKSLKEMMKKFNFKENVVPGGYLYSVYIPAMDKKRETLFTIGVNTIEGYAMFAITGKGITEKEDTQTIRMATVTLDIFEKDKDLVEMYIQDVAKVFGV